MNVEGQYNPKDVECIPVENLEVLPSGADWQSRHLESERRKAEIRDRIPLPDLPEQPVNMQQASYELDERGMPT